MVYGRTFLPGNGWGGFCVCKETVGESKGMGAGAMVRWNQILLVLFLVCLSLDQAAAQDVMNEQGAKAVNTLDLLQEETVSIAALHEQPISKAPSNVYVLTEEDIRPQALLTFRRFFAVSRGWR